MAGVAGMVVLVGVLASDGAMVMDGAIQVMAGVTQVMVGVTLVTVTPVTVIQVTDTMAVDMLPIVQPEEEATTLVVTAVLKQDDAVLHIIARPTPVEDAVLTPLITTQEMLLTVVTQDAVL